MLSLVPAAFLILMLLGALAVDSGATLLGQRQLQAAVEAAANDAAGGAISNTAFYNAGRVQLDPTRAAAIVCTDLAAQGDANLRATTVAMAVEGATVLVRARAEVPAVFGRFVPGLAQRPVTAQAGATAEEGPGSPIPASASNPAAVAFAPVNC